MLILFTQDIYFGTANKLVYQIPHTKYCIPRRGGRLIQKIDRPAAFKERAYAELKQAVMHQRLLPGEPLIERDLSEKLGISRTPIREALLLLEREGWVTAGGRKGFVVADISQSDVAEIFSLRRANESLAVELTVPRMTQADLDHLKGLYERQLAIVDSPGQEFMGIDREFHDYLASLSGNRRLIAFLQNLSDHMVRLGNAAISRPGRAPHVLNEHKVILDALSRREADKATAAMALHLDNTRVAILASLSSTERRGAK